ncbi:hypothetical protein [Paraflavitalea sp. CAU 1676]|uniref:hypothetical protein n=1 Tax=Paraflavitalea sp. CAU 1676 TaxID=3032598 RepID=UPI0023DB14FC|nr:hypothetical protein [Paraflavitalea sp. CAU 1676]MDF2188387.1 hypothetical protein [Paraflavitalea sp. CAU 1676]
MKKNLLFVLMLVSIAAGAQTTLNNYKVVLLPEKFDFQKSPNQYGLNLIAKSFLESKGFTVYYDNQELPKELAGDRCNALKVEVTDRKAIFTTNLTLFLKDCQGNIVFKGKEGKSREKEYNTAYVEAMNATLNSLNDVAYAYNGTPPVSARQTAATTTALPAATVAATPPANPPTPAVSTAATSASGTLYAQATANGYQLIDTKPQIVFTILKTSAPEIFLAEKGSIHGIVFKKEGDWVFEYYQEGKLLAEKLSIKF